MKSHCLKLWVVVCSVVVLAGCDLFTSVDTRVERAASYVQQREFRSALIELKNALQDEPEHVRARILLAEVSYQLGDVETADKESRRALQAGAKPEEVAVLNAKILLAMGQGRALLTQIDAGQLPLREPDRSLYRSYGLLSTGQVDLALDAFKSAMTAHPDVSALRVGYAEALMAQGRREDALKTLDTVVAQEPHNGLALLIRGTLLARLARFAEAETSLVAASDPRAQLAGRDQILALAALIESRLGRGDLSGARQSHSRLVEFAGNAPITALLGARISMAEQDYVAATAALQRVLARIPTLINARFLLGASLLAQGQLNQAELQLANVVQEAPEHIEARKLLARVRLRLERPDAAMQVLSPLEETADVDPSVNDLLALAQLQKGKTDEAVRLLQHGAAGSDARDAQLRLALAHLRSREAPKALQVLRAMPHTRGDMRREVLLIHAAKAGRGMGAAREEAARLLQQYPNDPEVLNFVAAFHASYGEFERARSIVGSAIALQPDAAESLLNAARIEVAAGNLSAAGERVRRLLAAQPKSVAARRALADLAVRAGDRKAAVRWLREIIQQDTQVIEPRLRLAQVYFADGLTRDADDVLRTLDAQSAARPQLANAIGLLLLEVGRYDAAAERFRNAAGADRTNAGYWLNLARAQLALDKRPLAREALETALSERPGAIDVIGALVMLDLRDGRKVEAARRLEALQRERANDANVHALAGEYYSVLKEFEAAAQAFDRAFALAPGAGLALKAYQARRVGKLNDTTAPLEAWVDMQPDDFMVQAVLAEAYQTRGQRDRAVATYEFITHNTRPTAAVFNNLAWLYYELRDPRALVTAQHAYQLAPKNPSVADTYGWLLVEGGEVQRGLAVLEPAAAAADDNAEIQYHFAAALARAGNKTQARERLQSLLARAQEFGSENAARRLLHELTPT